MRMRTLSSVLILFALLIPHAAAPASTPQSQAGLRATQVMDLPVGFWLGQWNSEQAALQLYQTLRHHLPAGHAVESLDGLISEQEEQIRLLQELYRSVMQPGSTPLARTEITPEVPPSKAPWRAHRPPTFQEIAWSALDYERRALLGYESITPTLTARPGYEKAERLLAVQRRQVRALLDLAGEPPE